MFTIRFYFTLLIYVAFTVCVASCPRGQLLSSFHFYDAYHLKPFYGTRDRADVQWTSLCISFHIAAAGAASRYSHALCARCCVSGASVDDRRDARSSPSYELPCSTVLSTFLYGHSKLGASPCSVSSQLTAASRVPCLYVTAV